MEVDKSGLFKKVRAVILLLVLLCFKGILYADISQFIDIFFFFQPVSGPRLSLFKSAQDGHMGT